MRKIILCALLALSACREATPPYEIENPFAGETGGRLTFNAGDDRMPAFGINNDTVVYLAQSFLPFGETNGMLLATSRAGGLARPVLTPLQVGVSVQPWLSAAAISPNGGSTAFWEVTQATDNDWSQDRCQVPAGIEADTAGSSSVLRQAILRVRRNDNGGAQDDARLVVNFEGRTFDATRHPFGLPYVIVNIAYPFHRHYQRYGVPIFRASWSPDGSRLVFSDGLRLRLWTPGQGTTTVIPNTEDAILPAWSPAGDEVAFTKLMRGNPVHLVCLGIIPGAKSPEAAYFDRTIYTGSTRDNGLLQVVKSDGTGLRNLGIGEAPAWTADGRTILVRRSDMIMKVPADGSAATPVANTSGGYEPAVSRDTRWVAFVRSVSPSNYDLWVAPY